MASISTMRGDAGETSLAGGLRVSKASARVETYGTVDELNSYSFSGVLASGPDRVRETSSDGCE